MQYGMKRMKNRSPFILISMGGVFLFCVYLFWFRDVISYNNMIFYGSTAIALGGVLADIFIRNGKVPAASIPVGWVWWLAFGIYCLLSSILFAIDSMYSIDSLIRYFAYIAIAGVVCYVSYQRASFDWIMTIFIVVTMICCAQMIVQPYQIYYSRFSLGSNNNPNSLATTMFFGFFCILFRMDQRGKRFWLQLCLVVLYLYVMMLANSRKIIFSALFLLVMWFVFFLKELKKGKLTTRKLLIYTILFAAVIFAGSYFVSKYMNSALVLRMQNFTTEESNAGRFLMYEEAFDFFLENPVFGIGFDCFRLKSVTGLYSHTTYGEAISCTGIIGAILYFTPIIKLIKHSMVRFIKHKTYSNSMMLGLLAVELFLAFGQILFYEIDHMIFFMIMFMYANGKYSRQRTKVERVR